MAKSEVIVQLTNAIYGGEMMGRLADGRAVFVPFTLPGEKARVRIVEEKRGHARAEVVELLEASPRRITPSCRHFGHCGGCHYQHVPYDLQTELKTGILREQLERIGGISDPPVAACHPAPEAWHYRNNIQYHLAPGGGLGYFTADGKQVFRVEECWLPDRRLEALRPLLDFEELPGVERIGLRAGMGDDLQIILESSTSYLPEISVEDLDVSVVHLSPDGSLVLAGSPALYYQVRGQIFRVSAGSFFQVNTIMAAAMVEHLLRNLGNRGNLDILEIYSGVGLFSAFLAPYARRLVAIESSTSAGEDFEENLQDFDHVELYEAPAQAVLPILKFKPDLVVVDPPRGGLERKALDGILTIGSPRLVYISCDPATLGRDARRLVAGGYRLAQVALLDLFPHTYSIESISTWEK
jgi:23S rRNA (uracil1939-C5)-methyltransferase